MPGDRFLDTNIFLYSFDSDEPAKQILALKRLADLRGQRQGITSYQVIQEFINIASRTPAYRENAARLQEIIRNTFAGFQIVWPSFKLYEDAIRIQSRYRFHWYDSLIVAAALEAKCDTLYTEDLQHGQIIEGLTVVNPFL